MKPEKQVAFQEGWNREKFVPLLPLVAEGLSFLKRDGAKKAGKCGLSLFVSM